ncbi:MAG: hypothetical protein OEM59_09295 [Rhodospirillales bacterium]|nr:hypothetical protein [Rhodospirillales bacterium]
MSLAQHSEHALPALPLRPPEEVMTPEAMSAFKASRLSFLRHVIGRMVAERWRIECDRFDLDEEGRGIAVYRLENPGRTLYFVVNSDNLPEERRTDRIVENHYDGEAFLCLGDPTEERIEFQRGQFRDFLLGRADVDTLGWTRVNRSSRVFNAIADALAEGRQPDMELAASAGYLVRNNGFWGNGRHGSAIFPSFGRQEFLGQPYHADLLTLFMWRHFSVELVEHVARCRNPRAAALAPGMKRFLGVGNASGLGLVPFLMRHPLRVHHWIRLRETAIARAKAKAAVPGAPETLRLRDLVARARRYYAEGIQVRPGIFQGSAGQVADLDALGAALAEFVDAGTVAGATPERPWAALCDWAASNLHREGIELLHSLLIEVHPELTADLEKRILEPVDDATDVRPGQGVGDLMELLESHYRWALEMDVSDESARKHFWYLSYDNLEPRHGLRGVDPGEEFETFVDTVGELQALGRDLRRACPEQSVGVFLFAHPQHRQTVERVQAVTAAGAVYGEIRANVLSDDFEPCHLIRYILTQYGMEKLDPQSRLWVRGTFLQGAPTAEDIADGVEGDWIFPLAPSQD